MPTARRAGGVTKRCECRAPDGKLLGTRCPLLTRRSHGRHVIRQELPPDGDGKRRTFRRTGYDDLKEANKDLARLQAILELGGDDENDQRRVGDLLAGVMRDRVKIPEAVEVQRKLGVGVELDGKMTVGQWLDVWMASKKTRDTTNRAYQSHIRLHLKPALGHLRLDRLSVGHVQDMFDVIGTENGIIAEQNAARREQEALCKRPKPGAPKAADRARLRAEVDAARAVLADMPPYRRITGPAMKQRIRATLRAALNKAIGRQMITYNAAEHVELDPGKRPKPQLWTAERGARWRETGEIPGKVMVWTPPQIGAFLDQAEGERLYAYYHLVAFRGLRRGEGLGQDWSEVNLATKRLTVRKELVVGPDGWTPVETPPKTDDAAASIGLGKLTAQVLAEHKERQGAEKKTAGKKWVETGKVFTTEHGEWLHPEKVSDDFRRICEAAGLPPINLRDLRHCAATLIHAGGGDMHAVKEVLRHSTITLASDTYTSLLHEVDLEIADKAETLVPRARKAAVAVG
jgi:integrase